MDYKFRRTAQGPLPRRGLRSLQLAACCARRGLGQAESVHLAAAWECWHLQGPIPGGQDPVVWTWIPLGQQGGPGQVPTPVWASCRESEGAGVPKGVCGGEAWIASQRPALVHSQGTLGSLLNLWGHSPGQQGQSCSESRRKLGVLRKILAVLCITVDKLPVYFGRLLWDGHHL